VAAGCEGIVPDSVGSSFTVDVPPPPSQSAGQCGNDTSDESGNLAFANSGSSSETFSPSGAHLGRIPSAILFPQGPGFEGIYRRESDPVTFPSFAYWTPDGVKGEDTAVGSDVHDALAFRSWTAGAVTITMACFGLPDPGVVVVRRFDPSGHQISEGRSEGGCGILGGAVGDANSNALIVIQEGGAFNRPPGDLVGRWSDRSGNPITNQFRISGPLATSRNGFLGRFAVRALSGGGAAIRLDGVWQWFIPSGSASVQAPPDWLAQHPQTDFTLVRDARAYAILHRGLGDPREIELYSLQGNRCGSVTFSEGGLTTGADGTVISASGAAGCHKTVWPGLLR
jgi:hypothetical protein